MAELRTSIRPRGPVQSRATSVYGIGDVLFRIGNGGAGATGLIEALATDYLSTLPQARSIEWICNHSLNTQVALHRGHIDLALTYEREREHLAEVEGWSRTAGCVFHDHFCLAGPRHDPADVRSAQSLGDALRRVARKAVFFHSRVDGSATMEKERQLWTSCGLEPWTEESARSWYKTNLETPAGALKGADEAAAYLLTDRSTLLHQTGLGAVSDTVVFVEPTSPDDVLMNSCYALYSPVASAETRTNVAGFLRYLLSERGQGVVESYGVGRCGLPLFAPVADGFARDKLRGREFAGSQTMLPARM
ncbi:hypothetical protein NLU13_8602 [Sarocladium strictum]|uniref:PBP domain-containing protein n=1 Tax=Sarocladium strictum TaxID=5046 RepID=A0AA39GCC1_SARSR|nr:hypothetical protein NLU13_8602 [Sarocladium strictum]